jgi:hypothetical protein
MSYSRNIFGFTFTLFTEADVGEAGLSLRYLKAAALDLVFFEEIFLTTFFILAFGDTFFVVFFLAGLTDFLTEGFLADFTLRTGFSDDFFLEAMAGFSPKGLKSRCKYVKKNAVKCNAKTQIYQA